MASLDPHQRPPEGLRALFKKYQKITLEELEVDRGIIHPRNILQSKSDTKFIISSRNETSESATPCNGGIAATTTTHPGPRHVIESRSMPGLQIVPSFLSLEEQWRLLDRLLHRDLADRGHNTNLHKHYHINYDLAEESDEATDGTCRLSFFNTPATSLSGFVPHDPQVHKPLTIKQILYRKLRWITLGGQYDWTEKRYPSEKPPAFPPDVANTVRAAYPNMEPEAAIVNIYSPGDTLSLHRDVSEESDEGLVSLSIGCDGLFLVGLELDGEEDESSDPRADQPEPGSPGLVIRLQSGDAVIMSGPARYAWHAVPQVIANTCPSLLQSWPAHSPGLEVRHHAANGGSTTRYESWRHWLSGKRINLNVRQMKRSR